MCSLPAFGLSAHGDLTMVSATSKQGSERKKKLQATHFRWIFEPKPGFEAELAQNANHLNLVDTTTAFFRGLLQRCPATGHLGSSILNMRCRAFSNILLATRA